MSLETLRKIARGKLSEDIERLRDNMNRLIQLQERILETLKEIEKCVCKKK